MASNDRRAAARRKAWGRGPMILRFEPLEGRQLLSTGATPPADATTTVVTDLTGGDDPAAADHDAPVAGSTDPGPQVFLTSSAGTSQPDDEDAAATTSAPQGQPDLTLDAFGTLHNLDWGQPFRAQGRVKNEGNAPAPAGVKVDIYASTTQSFGPGAVFVGTAVVEESIAPGETGAFDTPMIAPPLPLAGLGTSPSYYFVARVDADGVVAESSEANNGGGSTDPRSVVTVTPRRTAKLEGTAFLVSPGTTAWGQPVEIRAQITNIVPGTVAPPTRARVVLSPKDQSANGPDAVTIGEVSVPELSAYPPADLKFTVTLPATPPAALANSRSFNISLVPDADFLTATPLSLFLGHGSGRDSSPLTILPVDTTPPPKAKPDVTVLRLQPATDTVTWGQPFQVSTTVQNDGSGDAGRLRVRFLLADANRPDAAPLALSDAVLDALPAGYRQDILQTIPLEGALPPGVDPATIAPRVIVQVDPENTLDESSEANNSLASSPVKFRLVTKEGTSTDVPAQPGPVTTRPPAETPTPTGTTPDTVSPAEVPHGGRRWRLQQAHQAAKARRAARAAARKAARPRLLADRPRLRVANGTVRIMPTAREAGQA
jgi:hypothetical protein